MSEVKYGSRQSTKGGDKLIACGEGENEWKVERQIWGEVERWGGRIFLAVSRRSFSMGNHVGKFYFKGFFLDYELLSQIYANI